MGCLSNRSKVVDFKSDQKWEYISLNDFKNTSCFTPFAYVYLYLSLIISVAVYAVDTFTAISLLVLNKPTSSLALSQLISYDIAKWIFSVCIILSFINLGYEHIRARRVMKRGNVAECYLDSLAVRLESIPLGRDRGWKRFLVFAELTKSKKGAEVIAIFSYFSFQSWIRVIVCSGPRQVVNALTLLSVYNSRISATGANFENTLMDFFKKIRLLFVTDYRQALMLSGMLFTLVVWVFSFLFLLAAVLFFLFYLWGHIPRSDGGLRGFCARKVNKRLTQIVTKKVNKAIRNEEMKRRKAEFKAAKAGQRPGMELKATIPDVGDDKLPEMPMLSRSDTMTTLPPYTSRPGTAGSFEMGAMDQKRPPMPSRSGTTASSYSSRAPLLGHAADPGMMMRTGSPAPSLPSLHDGSGSYGGGSVSGPSRMGTPGSQRAFAGGPPPPPMLSRVNTNASSNGYGGYTASPATYSSERMPAMPPAVRSPVGPNPYASRPPMHSSNGSMDSYHSSNNPMSPGYPMRSATNPMPGPPRGGGGGLPYSPQRNMTAPVPHRQQMSNDGYDYRPPTSASQRSMGRPGYGNGWNSDLEGQRGGPGPRY